MDTIAMILAAAALTMMAPGFFLYRHFIRRLRARHEDTWEQIGRPTLIFYGSLDGSRRVHDFIRRRAYANLADPELARVCEGYRRFANFYAVTCAAAVVSLALSALGVGVR